MSETLETPEDLDALPEGAIRRDLRGVERVKGPYELWFRTEDGDNTQRVGITSFQMSPAAAEQHPFTVQDVIAQFDAHPYVPPAEGSQPTRVVRLAVNLAPSVADALTTTAGAQGVSITEAIRRAIVVYAELHDEQAAGRALLIKEGCGAEALFREFHTVWQHLDQV